MNWTDFLSVGPINLKHLPSGAARWINLGGEIWVMIFASSFALSILVGGVQMVRGKELWDTRLFPLMVILHWAWVIPLTLIVLAQAAIVAAPILFVLGVALVFLFVIAWLLGQIQRRRGRW